MYNTVKREVFFDMINLLIPFKLCFSGSDCELRVLPCAIGV